MAIPHPQPEQFNSRGLTIRTNLAPSPPGVFSPGAPTVDGKQSAFAKILNLIRPASPPPEKAHQPETRAKPEESTGQDRRREVEKAQADREARLKEEEEWARTREEKKEARRRAEARRVLELEWSKKLLNHPFGGDPFSPEKAEQRIQARVGELALLTEKPGNTPELMATEKPTSPEMSLVRLDRVTPAGEGAVRLEAITNSGGNKEAPVDALPSSLENRAGKTGQATIPDGENLEEKSRNSLQFLSKQAEARSGESGRGADGRPAQVNSANQNKKNLTGSNTTNERNESLLAPRGEGTAESAKSSTASNPLKEAETAGKQNNSSGTSAEKAASANQPAAGLKTREGEASGNSTTVNTGLKTGEGPNRPVGETGSGTPSHQTGTTSREQIAGSVLREPDARQVRARSEQTARDLAAKVRGFSGEPPVEVVRTGQKTTGATPPGGRQPEILPGNISAQTDFSRGESGGQAFGNGGFGQSTSRGQTGQNGLASFSAGTMAARSGEANSFAANVDKARQSATSRSGRANMENLIQRAKLVLGQGGTGSVNIRLQPAQLGYVTLNIKVDPRGQKIRGQIKVESQAALEQFLDTGREMISRFREAGFDIEEFELEMSGGNQTGGRQNDDPDTPSENRSTLLDLTASAGELRGQLSQSTTRYIITKDKIDIQV